MPELPEVETIRKGLTRRIRGKRVSKVLVTKPKIIRGSVTRFEKQLRGAFFGQPRRHGKLLILPSADDDFFVLIHLKMTGQLIYRDGRRMIAGGHQWPPVILAELPSKYTHVQISFEDGSELFFNDLRQFGFMELAKPKKMQAIVDAMGTDPITQDLSWEYFWGVVQRRTVAIKALLLDQGVIAGIGNIYADEICFRAHVLPQRSARSLSKQEARRIFTSILKVLERAIRYGGTTFRNYVDVEGGKGNFTQMLNVYGRESKKCRRCREGIIQKIRVAQRGTHFCPVCQT